MTTRTEKELHYIMDKLLLLAEQDNKTMGHLGYLIKEVISLRKDVDKLKEKRCKMILN